MGTSDRKTIKMKAVLVILGLFALSQGAPSNTWELFKAVHEKVYESKAEEYLRKGIFEKNVARIEAHNQKYEAGEETYKQGINKFTDWLQEEVVSTMNGFRASDKVQSDKVFVASGNVGILPDTVDWRDEGIVTPVKNQYQCGSCWAFSTTGSVEGQWALSSGSLVSLSEQQLVSCSDTLRYGNQGCQGGLMDSAFQYIIDNGGIESEAGYPYNSYFSWSSSECVSDASKIAATISNYVDVAKGDESALQEAVATIGPVSVTIDASSPSFTSYEDGVYNDDDCSSLAIKLDHGVLVVGYGTQVGGAQDGEEYWLVKNSWGSDWGKEGGYIKMARNRDNMCGIATQASYPIV